MSSWSEEQRDKVAEEVGVNIGVYRFSKHLLDLVEERLNEAENVTEALWWVRFKNFIITNTKKYQS